MSPNSILGVPTPQTNPQPTRYLTLDDGVTRLPLEFPCRHCQGTAAASCKHCGGKGSELSQQGRALLAFLDKWQHQDAPYAKETAQPAKTLLDTVIKDASLTVNAGGKKTNG